MKRKAVWSGWAFAAAAGLVSAGCGGSSDSGSPTMPDTGGGSGTTTITIGTDGRVSPSSVTVPIGSRVTFVNNHNVQHDMNSDPHPEHTQCPELNVGNLQPGQNRTSQNLNTARTCGFHDHNQPSNTGLQGTVRIQ